MPSARVPASARREIASMRWGAGPRELGRKRAQEGNAEGPMSLAIDAQGNTLVLDQVNGRVVRVGEGGVPRGTISVGEGAQDVAVARDGTVLVLDRLVDRNVTLYGPDGRAVGSLPVLGGGIAEGGQVTGVFADGTSVYVEREHGQLVRIGDTQGGAGADRSELPGRPSRDGASFVSAFLEAGRVFVSATTRSTMQLRYTRALSSAIVARGILLLDSDRFSTLYVATLGSTIDGIDVESITCVALEDGHVLGSVEVPPNAMPEETFREFAVLDQGGVLHAEMTESGMSYVRYDCR
jgi:hypothetical protein